MFKTLAVDLDAESPAEAVASVITLLEENGCAAEGAATSAQELFRKHGPYFVIHPGVAIPHPEPAFCTGNCVVVAVLRKPVFFGAGENDPVRLVIGYCALPSHHSCGIAAVARFLLHHGSRPWEMGADSLGRTLSSYLGSCH